MMKELCNSVKNADSHSIHAGRDDCISDAISVSNPKVNNPNY
jgi:hypothetical protein